MRAIFIDSINRTVTEIEINENEVLTDLEKFLKAEIIGLGGFVDRDNMLYVDAGLVAAERLSFKFDSPNFIYPISGNGVVLGINGDEDKACNLSLQWVKNKVKFLTNEERINLLF